MEHKIEFISINCNGEEREWHMTPTEMYEEYNGECDLPDLGDTIVSCVFAGTRLYFETFSEMVYAFFGEQ